MPTEIGQADRVFSLAEAADHLLLVQSITKKHRAELAPLQLKLEKMLSNDPRRRYLEAQYQAVVTRWRNKIEQLGANVAGLWMVEFSLGDAFVCWRDPELSLSHVRPRDADFKQRVALQAFIDEHDPDWA